MEFGSQLTDPGVFVVLQPQVKSTQPHRHLLVHLGRRLLLDHDRLRPLVVLGRVVKDQLP